MAYDRDSFLAGLAVGRTLWKPHTETQGNQYMSVPCYPVFQGIDLNWSAWGTEYTKFMFDRWTSNWPDPTYWFVWHNTGTDTWSWFLFSPDTTWILPPYIGVQTKGYNGSWVVTGSGMFSGMSIVRWSEAIVVRGTINLSFGGASSADFMTLGYFEGNSSALERFGRTTHLVQVGDRLRLIGVIP